MLKSGDVVLSTGQFADTFEVKKRPVLVLFEDFGNVVVAGVTSNISMKGIPLLRDEGAVANSVIKLNYIFTISEKMIQKTLLHLSAKKKKLVFDELTNYLSVLTR